MLEGVRLGTGRRMLEEGGSMTAELSIGVPGALGPAAVRVLAPRVEAAGFAGIWLNDSPQGDSLAGLAAAAEATTHLRLATGVIPVDRRPGPAIIEDLHRTGVPEARLTLGVGSGQLKTGALGAVTEALGVLRGSSRAAIVVGALGPRMRRLGAQQADGVLLSWLTPAVAAAQAEELRALGREAQGEMPRIALYARTIVDEAARPVLEREAAQYGSYPAYGANFARLGIGPTDTVLPPVGVGFAAGVAAYRAGVDELVLRAITPTGSLDDLLAFVDRAAALLA
jgi:alkanesulfonate monooxygenase SsuD/methylene tetrahydromethanopterin reductase-like flavin-dependent oxidoreductase (luciferase family)